MKILALDCGTKTGWAADGESRVESGVQTFELKRGESPGMRFIRFNAWLVEVIGLTHPDLVVYEMAHLRGGAATDLLVGMTTRVAEACARIGIECSWLHSVQVKKIVAGTGKATKDDMISVARKLFGRVPEDDNEADALCLWLAAKAQWDPAPRRAQP
jgi:Holliday junction resolvasome RuvABC endonuclease subunit